MSLLDSTLISTIVLTKTAPKEIIQRFGLDLEDDVKAKLVEPIEEKPTFHWYFYGEVCRGFAAIIDRGKNHKIVGRVWVHPHYRSEDLGRAHTSALLQEAVKSMPGPEMKITLFVKEAQQQEAQKDNGWMVAREFKCGSAEMYKVFLRSDDAALFEKRGRNGSSITLPARGYFEEGDLALKYTVRKR